MADEVRLLTAADIDAARKLLDGRIIRTPLIAAPALSEQTDTELFFKAEMLQLTGSYKPRATITRLAALSEDERQHGVLTISAGNLAQGLALAAAELGIAATVVLPAGAPKSKIAATRALGAEAVLHDGDITGLMARAQTLIDERGLTFIHPLSALELAAGNASIGMEILEDLEDIDVVLVPVGGGSLIAGIAAAVKMNSPKTCVIGVEPIGAPAMTVALAAGRVVPLDSAKSIADGLCAPFASENTLLHTQEFVDEIVLVSDEEIISALLAILEHSKLLCEGAGAAAFAALWCGKLSFPPGARVVCVLSGGNLDLPVLQRLLAERYPS